MPIKTIYEPIYQNKVHFIFDTPKEKALAYIKKQGFAPIDLDGHWEKAGCMYGEAGDYFIVIPDKKPTWTVTTIIAHEAFHVTCKALRAKGVHLSTESEEAYNYFQTWILQELTDIYNDHFKSKKTMKAKSKAATKADLKKFAAKDKKDDMKMIKAAIKKAKRK
jgi:hypothetical protein